MRLFVLDAGLMDHAASVLYRAQYERVEVALMRAAHKLGIHGARSVVPRLPCCDLSGYSLRCYDVLDKELHIVGGLMLEVMDNAKRYQCRKANPGAEVIVLMPGGYKAYDTVADYKAACDFDDLSPA